MQSWDAVETAQRIAKREVSASEILDAAIARAEQAGSLGAIVTETFERARSGAARARGPFAGVPTFIKDLAHVEGVSIGWGTRAVEGAISRRSDPVVKVFESLGLVILGKSATPELGMTATTEPLGRPPTRNPWDPSRSTGGSSGGAAALVAAGVVPIAHASDGGGSIRIPAASCGLVGLKPTRGRLDMEGSHLLPINVAVNGVVTRTVRDTIAFWAAVDEHQGRGRAPRPEKTAKLRIGYFATSPLGRSVSPEVHATVERAAGLCESLGHEVEPVPCPFPAGRIEDFVRYWALLAWLQDRGGRALVHPRFDRARLEPWTQGLSRWCEREPRALFSALMRLRRFAREHTARRRTHDVIISPVLAHPPPLLGHLATDVPFDVAMDRILEHVPFTGILNATGEPSLSLPLGTTEHGLPLGVQFSGHAFDEATLVSLALALEEAAPWAHVAPRAGA